MVARASGCPSVSYTSLDQSPSEDTPMDIMDIRGKRSVLEALSTTSIPFIVHQIHQSQPQQVLLFFLNLRPPSTHPTQTQIHVVPFSLLPPSVFFIVSIFHLGQLPFSLSHPSPVHQGILLSAESNYIQKLTISQHLLYHHPGLCQHLLNKLELQPPRRKPYDLFYLLCSPLPTWQPG